MRYVFQARDEVTLFTVQSLETLVGTLDQIKYDQKTIDGTTADESISLINARYQHLIELKSELESLETERKSDTNPLKLDLNINGSASKTKTNGLLMTCTMEKGKIVVWVFIYSNNFQVPATCLKRWLRLWK